MTGVGPVQDMLCQGKEKDLPLWSMKMLPVLLSRVKGKPDQESGGVSQRVRRLGHWKISEIPEPQHWAAQAPVGNW